MNPLELEAIGRAVAAGLSHAIQENQATQETEPVIALEIGALEEDAYAALAALASIDTLRAALAHRDAVELRLIGAEVILGRAPQLSIEEETELVAFEEALRPHLWRLTALNDWRAREVAWIAPAYRLRFWWWSEGSEIDPRGALHLDAVAELVARFPEAELQLRRLATTEMLIRTPPAVIDLRSWIRARTPSLALAASTGPREQILFEHPSFTLSLLDDALLIDLLEPCGVHPPRLQIDDRTLDATPVANALERYRFELAPLLDASQDHSHAELIVALVSGVLRVSLPPDQRSVLR